MEEKVRTPIKAIRAKCLECSNGSAAEVTHCPIKRCALYPYRHGHRPGWENKHKKHSEESD